jgi:hypothetical protein
VRGLDTGNQQLGRVQQTNLHQQRCLIPIDVLISELVARTALLLGIAPYDFKFICVMPVLGSIGAET